MAFGKRLFLTYQDDNDSPQLAEIWQEGYEGEASEMTMGSIPVNLKYGGDGWKNIVGQEATVSFFSNDDLSWLNTADGQDIKFVFYRNGVLNFTGFALPDQFVDSLGTYPREFMFVASDRLGILNTINYVDGDGEPFETFEEAIIIIAQCLAFTGLELVINNVCNLFEDSMSSGPTFDPFVQLDVRQDVVVDDQLNPGSCAAMLDVILKTFQLKLFQSAGEWWLWRVPETEDNTIEYRIFNSSGVRTGAGGFSSDSQLKTTNKTTFRLLANSRIEGIQPYRDVTLNSIYDKRDTIFRAGNISENEFINSTTFNHWVNVNGAAWEQLQSGNKFLMKADAINPLEIDKTKFIRTEKVPVQASAFNLVLSTDIGTINAIASLWVMLILEPTAGGNDYYYGGSIGVWDNSGTPLSAIVLANGLINPSTYNNAGVFELDIDGIPVDGDIYVAYTMPGIGAGSDEYFFSYCKLQFTDKGESDKTTIVINTNNNLDLDFTLNLTDAPTFFISNNAFSAYRGVAQVDGDVTNDWQLNGAGTKRKLIEWIQQWTGATDSLYRFDGSIRGSSNYFNAIQITEFNDEVFLWEDVTYNTKTRIWQGRAIQLKGVLLQGATSTVSPTSVGSSSGGNGGSVVIPPAIPSTDHRVAIDVELSSGDNTVPFSFAFDDGITYRLDYKVITVQGGYKTEGTVTNEIEASFDINVDEACLMSYTATQIL